MRILAPTFEAGKVDLVFNGHVHNYQRTYPMTFVPSAAIAPHQPSDRTASCPRPDTSTAS